MTKRVKDFKIHIQIHTGVAKGVLHLATEHFKDPEHTKAFQEWKAAQESASLQKAL